MGKQLREIVESYLIKNGSVGMATLCGATGKSQRTIGRWLESGIPSAHQAYKIALACGVGEDEALQLSKEESGLKAKESA